MGGDCILWVVAVEVVEGEMYFYVGTFIPFGLYWAWLELEFMFFSCG